MRGSQSYVIAYTTHPLSPFHVSTTEPWGAESLDFRWPVTGRPLFFWRFHHPVLPNRVILHHLQPPRPAPHNSLFHICSQRKQNNQQTSQFRRIWTEMWWCGVIATDMNPIGEQWQRRNATALQTTQVKRRGQLTSFFEKDEASNTSLKPRCEPQNHPCLMFQ